MLNCLAVVSVSIKLSEIYLLVDGFNCFRLILVWTVLTCASFCWWFLNVDWSIFPILVYICVLPGYISMLFHRWFWSLLTLWVFFLGGGGVTVSLNVNWLILMVLANLWVLCWSSFNVDCLMFLIHANVYVHCYSSLNADWSIIQVLANIFVLCSSFLDIDW